MSNGAIACCRTTFLVFNRAIKMMIMMIISIIEINDKAESLLVFTKEEEEFLMLISGYSEHVVDKTVSQHLLMA